MDLSQIELGPKMLACSVQERKFVLAYLQNGGKDATAAARAAGYSDPGMHSSAIRVRGHEVLHRQRVLEAIKEVGNKYFQALLIPAIAAMEDLIDNPKHPDHAKTVFSTLSRLGLTERSGLDVNMSGSVTLNHTDEAIDQLRMLKSLAVPREKLVEIFGFSGLDRYERMLAEADHKRLSGPVIEGEVVRG